MIGYITLGTSDLKRAATFYDALLAEMGAKRYMESEKFVAWAVRPDLPALGVILPFDGRAATPGNGTMVALAADSTEVVDRVQRKAMSLGAKDEGAPGARGLLRRILPRPGRQQAQRLRHGLSDRGGRLLSVAGKEA